MPDVLISGHFGKIEEWRADLEKLVLKTSFHRLFADVAGMPDFIAELEISKNGLIEVAVCVGE